jgi:lysozyme
MSKTIIPPSRPHRDAFKLGKVLKAFRLDPAVPVLVFIRGHYLNSIGVKERNDLNVYDDACFLIADNFVTFDSFNANTDPSSFTRKGRALAQLDLGQYQFYRGKHRGKYDALRTFPEGKKLPCKRNGVPSFCQYINIHRGGTNPASIDVTHSEGCLTIPASQYQDFISRVYALMTQQKLSVIQCVLLENRQTPEGQRWFDGTGKLIV